MKDLTHYFVSPPKSLENLESIEVEEDNLEDDDNNASMRVVSIKKEDDNNDKGEENRKSKYQVKKRPRVKMRFSFKDSKNHSCDIVESKNDLVDKTPSPFRRLSTNMNPPVECNEYKEEIILLEDSKNSREKNQNAFKVLMTRNKSAYTQGRDLTSTSKGVDDFAKERKAKINKERNKDKLVDLEEKKGYSKRKHSELEEVEIIEKKLEKKARLFTRDAEKGGERKKKDREAERNNEDEIKNNDKNNAQEIHNVDEKREKNFTYHNETVLRSGQSSMTFDNQITSKSKHKWKLRVMLQGHSSDEDEEVSVANGNISEDDYIFTPKSKVKFRKLGTGKISSNGDVEEAQKPVDKSEKPDNRDEPTVADPPVSSKHGKHKIKRKKRTTHNLESLETDACEEFKRDTSSKNLSHNHKEINADCSIEILEDNHTMEINRSPVILYEKKLAPLFVKRRTKLSSEAIEAKRSFLQSGIPITVKKIMSEQKPCCNVGTSTMPFPTISHVSQSHTDVDSELTSSGTSFVAVYKHRSDLNQLVATSSIDVTKFKSLANFNEKKSERLRKAATEKLVQIERENYETVVKEIESRCSETRKLWESITSSASNGTPKSSRKRNKILKLPKKTDVVPLPPVKDNLDNLNPAWTCKYKPMSSMGVVGNETAISKLRNWLSGWRLPSSRDDYSSGDEFYSSDCSNSNCFENNQVAVLLGPHGSGKSASVYAIAEELGYRVLEVNASSRRTGKKLLADFQEATKSHRVKRDQATLLPLKKKPTEKKVPQNSLILIEDVDLIFEEDEGFISATFQLAANTKRPIVMTCKEPCPHLSRMAPQQQLIHFQTVTGNRVSALLELIALAESGYRIPKSCLDILLRNGDLRQSLLQLQYILLSGPPCLTQLGICRGLTLWQDMQPFIYKPAIKSSKRWRKVSSSAKLLKEQETELFDTLAKRLDNISLVSSLTEVENPTSPPWRKKLNPSLSLLEDFKPYSKSDDLGAEIADWLRITTLESNETDTSIETNAEFESQFGIKRKVKIGIDFTLSQAIPSTLEHRSKATDYLPVLRTMCRLEEDRASINTKRGKRFHNYLHGLNLSSASSNILAAAGSVFKDDSA